MNEFTMSNIEAAVKLMANNKAAGEDGITAEMFQAIESQNLRYLLGLFNKIWQEEKVPSKWKRGIIVKIPKKGNLSDCNNWRGVTLLSVASKVFCKIIMN
jgi:hypothetical protein